MINAAQQQVLQQYYGELQKAGEYIRQLLGQAATGCQQMTAQNPLDPTPLSNALGAIGQQVEDVARKMSDYWSTTYEHLTERGESEPAYSHGKRADRAFRQWVDETWFFFDLHQRAEQFKQMWPLVEQAMQKPAACTRCGAPLQRTAPHRSETINCASCRVANQVMPETAPAVYYATVPHYFAELAAGSKRFAHQRLKNQWDDHRDAEYAAKGDRPEPTLEYFKQREAAEKDYWTTYAETKTQYEGGKPEDAATLVEARMKFFYEEMNREDVWRKAHGVEEIVVVIPPHLQNVDEWGPLRPDQFEENQVHESLLSEAIGDPPRYKRWLAKLGYREPLHRALVQRTFQRYAESRMGDPAYHEAIGRAAMRSMSERQKMLAEEQGAPGGILDAIEGCSILLCGQIYAKQANAKPDEFTQFLATHAMDREKWERVSKAWLDRMSKDTTGVLATEYSKGFMAAGEGQFGGAGQAAAGAMEGGFGQQAASGPAPMPFEKYADISGAMAAWSKQGKDISAGLHKHFNLSAQDFSNVSMYWSTHMMQDFSMMDRLTKLTADAERKWLSIT